MNRTHLKLLILMFASMVTFFFGACSAAPEKKMSFGQALTILDLDSSARQEEIKRAYFKLALTYHPDKGGDVDVFKKISEAYGRLKDGGTQEFAEFTAAQSAFNNGEKQLFSILKYGTPTLCALYLSTKYYDYKKLRPALDSWYNQNSVKISQSKLSAEQKKTAVKQLTKQYHKAILSCFIPGEFAKACGWAFIFGALNRYFTIQSLKKDFLSASEPKIAPTGPEGRQPEDQL